MAITLCTSRKCTTENKNTGAACIDPTVAHVGLVLTTRERNGAHDSDFFATVWDEEKLTTRDIPYASTASWTYHNSAVVDATPDVIAKAAVVFAGQLAEQWIADAELAASRVERDMLVKSTTTRGKNVGVTGVVKWMGNGFHGPTVGVKVAGEEKLRYLDAGRVAPVNPAPVDKAAIRARAAAHVAAGRAGKWLVPGAAPRVTPVPVKPAPEECAECARPIELLYEKSGIVDGGGVRRALPEEVTKWTEKRWFHVGGEYRCELDGYRTARPRTTCPTCKARGTLTVTQGAYGNTTACSADGCTYSSYFSIGD